MHISVKACTSSTTHAVNIVAGVHFIYSVSVVCLNSISYLLKDFMSFVVSLLQISAGGDEEGGLRDQLLPIVIGLLRTVSLHFGDLRLPLTDGLSLISISE